MHDIQTAPFVSSTMRVEPDWMDHNGHLHMAYYHVLLDRAFEEFGIELGLGSLYVKKTNCSLFAAEAHIRYLREVHVNDMVRATVLFLAFDQKRIHTVRQIRHAEDGWLSATSENMTLHVDLLTRKVVPFPTTIEHRLNEILAIHQLVKRPDSLGRSVTLPNSTQHAGFSSEAFANLSDHHPFAKQTS
ncbi:thioesterase family protein [Bradyrhizobium sp. DOA9]|uniref:thioesterase family protein n=1 Tax=Bradyrhizobium sp. DOA9 TaxID=1126627 RepID=UPI0004998AB6|nr:thioesterase family protein [Bradyrhizobium sp. DOA9]GAJ37775.1 hypothetical protein BDOA9_0203930 [Bradyrhizobium sp. DOA9]